jgi:hypothetical protein
MVFFEKNQNLMVNLSAVIISTGKYCHQSILKLLAGLKWFPLGPECRFHGKVITSAEQMSVRREVVLEMP